MDSRLALPLVSQAVVGILPDRLPVAGFGPRSVPIEALADVSERRVRFGERRINLQGFQRRCSSLWISVLRRSHSMNAKKDKGVREAGVGQRVGEIDVDRLLEQRDGPDVAGRSAFVPVMQPLEIACVGSRVDPQAGGRGETGAHPYGRLYFERDLPWGSNLPRTWE